MKATKQQINELIHTKVMGLCAHEREFYITPRMSRCIHCGEDYSEHYDTIPNYTGEANEALKVWVTSPISSISDCGNNVWDAN